jgi:hypothetical protein
MSDTQQDGEPASDGLKIDGIVEQMRGDLGQGNVDDVRDVLRQRLTDAGISVSDDEFENLVRTIS